MNGNAKLNLSNICSQCLQKNEMCQRPGTITILKTVINSCENKHLGKAMNCDYNQKKNKSEDKGQEDRKKRRPR